jgi:hypothetical protein
MTSKRGWLDLSTRFARYAIRPTWPRLFALAFAATRARVPTAPAPDIP